MGGPRGAPSEETEELPPVTPVAFDILLALLDGAAHGYAIMQAVEHRARPPGGLHPGTLYRALSRMAKAGLIEELEEPPAEVSDERRRYYRVTDLGRRAAMAEARRLEARLGAARAHGLLREA
jgi:DNA-binding PadR family transcriptional regulator